MPPEKHKTVITIQRLIGSNYHLFICVLLMNKDIKEYVTFEMPYKSTGNVNYDRYSL